MDPEVLEDKQTSRMKNMRYGPAILQDPLDPYCGLLREFSNVVNDDPSSVLSPDRGVRHEIDLVPSAKYCTTRQWPLSKEQVDVINAFFAAKHAAGMVRELKSPQSSPTFCVRKPNGKWRMGTCLQQVECGDHTDVDANPEEGCVVQQHGGLHGVQCPRHGRWILSVAHAQVRYSAHSG
ncbi:unnamed protein product [Phytophthora fragariaefolia]|uniref:Unnamed protein product n=1 Tax=Phytophthora fragariaefolia TaxID=1490495 RepID=A0A9W6TTY1_9STRA|nr:unnamed protein product [Phytophthora fragariaefolia]